MPVSLVAAAPPHKLRFVRSVSPGPCHPQKRTGALWFQHQLDEVDEYSQLIPLDHLSMLDEVIEASLKPAARADLAKAVAVLSASFKVGDVLERAIIQARRTIKWLPSIAEMIAICNELFDERRSQLYIVQWMIGEHRR